MSIELLGGDVACERSQKDQLLLSIRQIRELTALLESSKVLRPLGAKPVGSSEGSISSADDEGVDSMLDEVQRGSPATFDLPEGSATSGADESSSEGSETANIVPSNL